MSIRKIYLLCIFTFFLTVKINAQQTSAEDVKKAVGKVISQNMIAEKIKDSTAVYSFSITISITNQKGKQSVKTGINNNEVALFFKGLDSLKNINYTSILKKKNNAKFSFKGYILVHNSKYDQDLVEISTLSEALKYLFLINESDIENLGNIILEYDKKIYN